MLELSGTGANHLQVTTLENMKMRDEWVREDQLNTKRERDGLKEHNVEIHLWFSSVGFLPVYSLWQLERILMPNIGFMYHHMVETVYIFSLFLACCCLLSLFSVWLLCLSVWLLLCLCKCACVKRAFDLSDLCISLARRLSVFSLSLLSLFVYLCKRRCITLSDVSLSLLCFNLSLILFTRGSILIWIINSTKLVLTTDGCMRCAILLPRLIL